MPNTICILGGTGFVGRHLVNRLSRDGNAVRVLTRRREHHRELLVIPTCTLIEADVYDSAALEQHFAGCSVVINLVGILNERGDNGRGFHKAHVGLTDKAVNACKVAGVRQYLHMSALNADADKGDSHYLRSKGEAEDLAHAAAGDKLQVASFQPSVIFGADDSFFNRFAQLLRWAPVFPLACPQARFAPVYIGDVVEAMARLVGRSRSAGKRYALCGPQDYSLAELVRMTARYSELQRVIWPLGSMLSRMQAWSMEFMPGKPFSRDNFRSMQTDSVCRDNALPSLGITPRRIEDIVPAYLHPGHQRARYNEFRRVARRD